MASSETGAAGGAAKVVEKVERARRRVVVENCILKVGCLRSGLFSSLVFGVES